MVKSDVEIDELKGELRDWLYEKGLADFLSRYIPMDGGGRLARRMIYIAVDEKKLRRR